MPPIEAPAVGKQDGVGEIVDAVFGISCRSLPVDHAYALSQAIRTALPWFADEPHAGLHTVHGAASGAGWTRPEGEGALLQLSRRAKLVLRLPSRRLDDTSVLLGRTLQVAGRPMRVDAVTVRPLSRMTTLYSRCVVAVDADDEASFLRAVADDLGVLGIEPARTLCGRVTEVQTPARTYLGRSLLLAGFAPEKSLALQRHGLGAGRTLGCGLFIPHKHLSDLRGSSD